MNDAQHHAPRSAPRNASAPLSGRGEAPRAGAKPRAGKVKYALLGWLIGLPLPILVLLLFFRGCDF